MTNLFDHLSQPTSTARPVKYRIPNRMLIASKTRFSTLKANLSRLRATWERRGSVGGDSYLTREERTQETRLTSSAARTADPRPAIATPVT